MTNEQFQALLKMAGTKVGSDGWSATEEERHLTLHAGNNGVGLTVSRVVALRLDGELLLARTSKGDQFLLNLQDIFAASVEASKEKSRQAGFR